MSFVYYNGIGSIRITIRFQLLVKSQPDFSQIDEEHRRVVVDRFRCSSYRPSFQAIKPYLRHIVVFPSQKA